MPNSCTVSMHKIYNDDCVDDQQEGFMTDTTVEFFSVRVTFRASPNPLCSYSHTRGFNS